MCGKMLERLPAYDVEWDRLLEWRRESGCLANDVPKHHGVGSIFKHLAPPSPPPFSLLVSLQAPVSLGSASVTRRKPTSASRTALASFPGELPPYRGGTWLSLSRSWLTVEIDRTSSNIFGVQLALKREAPTHIYGQNDTPGCLTRRRHDGRLRSAADASSDHTTARQGGVPCSAWPTKRRVTCTCWRRPKTWTRKKMRGKL